MPAADRYLKPGDTYGVEVYLTLPDTALAGRYLRTAVKKTPSSPGYF